jgi:sec-independent protein translocase protein TatB
MLPEIGATEMLVIAAVALIVVGPKDLPLLLRKIGQFVAKLRGMASEFRASFDEMARQSELDELRQEVQAMREGRLVETAVGADDVNTVMREIDQGLRTGDVSFNPADGYRYEPTPEEVADASASQPDAVAAPEPAKSAPRERAPAKASAGKAKATPARSSSSKAKPPAKAAATKAPPAKAPRKRAPAKPKTGAGG